ncbi:MAG: hypothetical protein K8R40_11555 [Anaerolineaceae bacterium]|nr:hypothetical protein [Anaerolineaceae bacterium]
MNIHKSVHFIIVNLIIFFLLFQIQPVTAHAADQYLHEIEITIRKDEIIVDWLLKPGPFLAGAVWVEADKNSDDWLDNEEILQFCEMMVSQLLISVEGRAVSQWQIDDYTWPQTQDELSLGEGITLLAHASIDTLNGRTAALEVENTFHPYYSVTLYTIRAGDLWQVEEMNQSLNQLSGSLTAASGEDSESRVWVSQQPDLSAFRGENQQVPGTNQTIRERLNSILTSAQNRSGVGFVVSAFFVALLLGMLHAFTPGHGKSIVAAYMIGAKGNWLQGALMGLTVAITHTGTVILTGLLVLLGARIMVIENIYPLLEIVSAIVILGLGAGLLIQRLRYVQKQKQKDIQPPPKVIQEEDGQTRIIIHRDILEETPPHPHIGPKYVPRHRANIEKLEWRTLLALGTSGGLVPCPDAVAVFIIAATMNMLDLGLLMIVAFSIGIAIILMLLGFLIAKGKRNLEKVKGLQKTITYAPIISAAVLVVAGFYLLNSAYQKYQPVIASTFSKQTLSTFDVENSQIAFLDYDPQNLVQIFTLDIATGKTRQITQVENGVSSFILSPEPQVLYYTRYDSEGNQGEIWSVNIKTSEVISLVVMPAATIYNLRLSPDKQWLLFERTDLEPSDGIMILTSIWKWQVESGELLPLLNSEDLFSFSPGFSPQMNWFSYYNPNANRYEIYHLESGSEIQVDSQIGSVLEWEPDSDNRFLYTDSFGDGKTFALHILLYDLQTSASVDLTEKTGLHLREGFWSSESGKIIGVIFETGNDAGSQFYQIDPVTYAAEALTEKTPLLPSDFDWSPNDSLLLYKQWGILDNPEWNGIWYTDFENGESTRLCKSGHDPLWLEWD